VLNEGNDTAPQHLADLARSLEHDLTVETIPDPKGDSETIGATYEANTRPR
jgi:subtilase family serine protease